jgi:hypothetical protein
MANKKIWLGILVLVFGMAVVGCDDESTNENGSAGKLIITGLDAYNGKYVFGFDGPGIYQSLFAVSTVNINDQSATGGLIGNGRVTLNVWKFVDANTAVPFTENATGGGFKLVALDSPVFSLTDGFSSIGYAMVDLKNGGGNGQFVPHFN